MQPLHIVATLAGLTLAAYALQRNPEWLVSRTLMKAFGPTWAADRTPRENYFAGAYWSARIALALSVGFIVVAYLATSVWPERALLLALFFGLTLLTGMAWLATLLLLIRGVFTRAP